MLVYCSVLGLIYLQNIFFKNLLRTKRSAILLLVNLELLAFLCFYQFGLMAQRIFGELPIFHGFEIIPSLFALLLYFGGITIFHATAFRTRKVFFQSEVQSSLDYALLQLRMIIPFTIPFLLFTFALDLIKLYPSSIIQEAFSGPSMNLLGSLILFVCSLLFMLAMMVFLPFFIQLIWKCTPLEESELKKRLDKICEKANFKHGGMKIWTVMNDSLTAAIVGVIPKFRYVMFTKRLLNEFPEDAIEAILVHEIGHSYRKHLLIYPFIIFGMMVVAGLFSLFISETLIHFLTYENMLHPSNFWSFFDPLIVFILYALLIAVYFRLVFGFFSRLFERQADLHVFQLQEPAEKMILALDSVGVSTGNSHKIPSWHHYSIEERINFLRKASLDHKNIDQHHQKVKFSLAAYSLFLLIGICMLVAPIFPTIPFFKEINHFTVKISNGLNRWANKSLSQELAKEYLLEYNLQGNTALIEEALVKSFILPDSFEISGMFEYHASKILLSHGELSASAILMVQAWKKLDPKGAKAETLKNFSNLTKEILQKISYIPSYNLEKKELLQALE